MVERQLRQRIRRMPGRVGGHRRIVMDGHQPEVGGGDHAPWMPGWVAARLQLLKVGQLPDVDLGGQVPADRCLQRFLGPEQPSRQCPCAVEGLPRPLPQQRLKFAVAHLEYDGERLMAGLIASAQLAHQLARRLSTHSRKLLDVRPPATPAARMFTDRIDPCQHLHPPPQPGPWTSKRSWAPPDSPPSTAGPWPSPAPPGPSWPWRSCWSGSLCRYSGHSGVCPRPG